MNDAPTVSVLIKSYNHAAYVAETIESVLRQSCQDFEILVTDDASTDGTPDVVRRFADPRIKLEVSPINRGVSLGMRSLLARATGRYVAILNSDDFALPDRLERQIAFLDDHPAVAGVFTNVVEVDDDGAPLRGRSVFAIPATWPDHDRPRWLRHFFLEGNCLCAPSAMLRLDAMRQIEAHDPRFTSLQDFDLWVRLISRHEIGYIAEPLTAFRKRAGLRNLGARRPDTVLRGQFEWSLILQAYLTMPAALIEAIFEPELDGRRLDSDLQKMRWLADMALKVSHPSHQLFALRTLFEAAETQADYDRLRQLAGEIDLFNMLGRPSPGPFQVHAARAGRLIRRLAAALAGLASRRPRSAARPSP